jgi:hypothetical protein
MNKRRLFQMLFGIFVLGTGLILTFAFGWAFLIGAAWIMAIGGLEELFANRKVI